MRKNHLWSQACLLGSNLTLPICDGRVTLGTWQVSIRKPSSLSIPLTVSGSNLGSKQLLLMKIHIKKSSRGIWGWGDSHKLITPKMCHHYHHRPHHHNNLACRVFGFANTGTALVRGRSSSPSMELSEIPSGGKSCFFLYHSLFWLVIFVFYHCRWGYQRFNQVENLHHRHPDFQPSILH